MLCKNPLGRLEFNQNRVRNHYLETITRLETEKQQEEDEKDLFIIKYILSTIISNIEHEENEILSLIHTIISSIDDIPKSTIPTNILSSNLDKSILNSIQTQRACHMKSSIRCKTSTPSTSSITIISTKLS